MYNLLGGTSPGVSPLSIIKIHGSLVLRSQVLPQDWLVRTIFEEKRGGAIKGEMQQTLGISENRKRKKKMKKRKKQNQKPSISRRISMSSLYVLFL